MTPQLIGVYVTIALFITAQVIGIVFAVIKFSSSVGAFNATLVAVKLDLDRLNKTLEKFDDERYTKHDAEKDFAIRDREHDKEHRAMWKQIDKSLGKQTVEQ